MLFIKIVIGKTTFIENLISSKRVPCWKTIYYVYPHELGKPPVNWDTKFENVNVQFVTNLPDLKFFDNAEEGSLIVIDDLWTEACKSADVIKCFKVLSRKKNISVIIVTQAYFSGGSGGIEIRNNWFVLVEFILSV